MKIAFFKGPFCALLITVMLLSTLTTKGQGVQIGDQCPDVEIKHILNYSSTSARLSDFMGKKALLISFWSSFCSNCIETFPKLDSLQNEFKDDLNVLLVNFESKEKALSVFKEGRKISHIKLASVVADTLLKLMFAHNAAPHEIWIDKNGKVKGITDNFQINRKNVRSLIAGEELNLPIKKDNMTFDRSLAGVCTLDKDKLNRYSYLSASHPGVNASGGGPYIDEETGLLKAEIMNGPFLALYYIAYGQWGFGNGFNFNRIIIEPKIADRYKVYPKGSIYDRDNFIYDPVYFFYESWWRDTSRTKACLDMQNEFDRFFNVESRLEKRKMPCIVLKEKGKSKRYRAINSMEKTESYAEKDTFFLQNVRLKPLLINTLNGSGVNSWSPFQLIDETGYDGKVTIRLPAVFKTVEETNRYLKDLDLEIVKEKRWMDVIIIKEVEKR